ncbi:hypothetical protein GGI43DRAFT_157346 [Trichoderma evansii]
MSYKTLFFFTLFYTLFSHVASSALVVRNLPGKSSDETINEVRRRLASVKRNGTDVLFENSTSFDLGLDGATIFKYPFDNSDPAITIICTKCYFSGQAGAKVTSKGSVNITSTIDQVEDSFKNILNNIETYAENATNTFKEDLKNGTSIMTALEDIEELPPPDIDFNLDLALPEYNVDMSLANVEIYMEIDTVLAKGITYTFNIYQSETLAGVALGNGLLLGAVFSVDLIFSVNAQIDIQSGFHIHFDNVRTQIDLFGEEASELTFNGGKFAFLPVTIHSGEVVLEAVLRLEGRLGISLHNFSPVKDIDVGAGVEARIYANVAEFVTNITLGEVDSLKKRDDDDNCQLSIAQAYTFGIGAGAGASLVILGNSWGPTPETEIPIFYTTMAQACIVTSKSGASTISTTTAAPSSTNGLAKRSATSTVTSTVTVETQLATVCASSGLINCPASLQSLTKNIITKTLTSTIASGSSAVWSDGTASAFKMVEFPTDAVIMTSSSGKPKSYTPPPPPPTTTASSSSSGSSGENSGKHHVSNAVIIGVSVGLGVPVLLAAIAAIIYFVRRNRKLSPTLQPAGTDTVMKAQPVVTTYTAVHPEDDL